MQKVKINEVVENTYSLLEEIASGQNRTLQTPEEKAYVASLIRLSLCHLQECMIRKDMAGIMMACHHLKYLQEYKNLLPAHEKADKQSS